MVGKWMELVIARLTIGSYAYDALASRIGGESTGTISEPRDFVMGNSFVAFSFLFLFFFSITITTHS
jgi:hypothetical protein